MILIFEQASVNSETSPLPPPKDHRPDQPNGDISKEMLTSPRMQGIDFFFIYYCTSVLTYVQDFSCKFPLKWSQSANEC